MKQIVLFTTVVLAIILALALAWQLRNIVLLFLLSLVIAATVRAPIEALIQSRLSRSLAMFVVYCTLFGFIICLLIIISIFIVDEFAILLTDVSTGYGQLQTGWQSGRRLGPLVASRLPPPEQMAQWLADEHLVDLAQAAMGLTQNLTNLVSQIVLAIILSMYWTADRLRFERLWLSLLPTEERIQARTLWRTLEDGVGAYTRSELTQSFLAGGLLTLGYWILGLDYPFLLALFAALAWLIPLIGGLIALIAVAAFAWLNAELTVFIAAIVYTICILAFMEFAVERLLYHYSRHQRVFVLLVMIALVDVYGLMGLLIAPFLATAIQIFLSQLMEVSLTKTTPASLAESFQADLSTLKSRLEEARALIHKDENEPASLRLANLTDRLTIMLQETEAVEVNSQRANVVVKERLP